MLTTLSKAQVALIMGGAGALPSYIAIGTGSATMISGATALVTETDRNALTETDVAVTNDVTYITDFSANEISGTILTEFGLFNANTGPTMYERVQIGSVTANAFDGTRELQIQMTHRYLLSGT